MTSGHLEALSNMKVDALSKPRRIHSTPGAQNDSRLSKSVGLSVLLGLTEPCRISNRN